MFLVIPVENKPSWKSPPWITILLIVCNVLIFFGWQESERLQAYEAAEHYEQTQLPTIELPAFVNYLQEKSKTQDNAHLTALAKHVQKNIKEKEYADAYIIMWYEHDFRMQLLAGDIIRTDHAQYELWRSTRSIFKQYIPQAFTTRWAQDYNHTKLSEIIQQPITLLTSTFLHGDFDHLFFNMVFLFIFGFTLEKTLKPAMYLLLYLLSGFGASLVAAWSYAGVGSYGLGASGAIAGLMAMYVVLYRLRKIRFFYFILFYFSYATLPALIMLPVWMGYEVLLSFISDSRIAYMAHFGGLLSGAILMAIWNMLHPLKTPVADDAPTNPSNTPQQTALDAAIARAKKHTDKLEFDQASAAWRQAAKIHPSDTQVLQSWFEIAQYTPAGKDFHAAAAMIFQLKARNAATWQLQQDTYNTYIDKAKPHVRLRPQHMLQLAHTFIALNDLHEAERLCRLLEKTAPEQNGFADLISTLAAAWARAQQPTKATAWLPVLQQLAPNDPVVSWLQKM